MEALTDETVVSGLDAAVRLEREAAADVLRWLIEFERRRLLDGMPFPSLFAYCTERLGYSPDEAYRRIRVARAAAKHPQILDLLERRRTDFSRVVTVSPYLDAGDAAELLRRACAMSQRELEFYVAGLAPKVATRDTIRPVCPSHGHAILAPPAGSSVKSRAEAASGSASSGPASSGPASSGSAASGLGLSGPPVPESRRLPEGTAQNLGPPLPPKVESESGQSGSLGPPWPGPFPAVSPAAPSADDAPAPPKPDRVEPLSQELARISFTADRETVKNIDRACALLRCRRSNLGPVIARALKLLIKEIDPEARPTKKTRRKSRPCDPRARRAPQEVRDAVWKRDGGQCAFRDSGGRRCGARGGLEFDHVRPWASGGRSDDPAGIRLLCRLHNQAAARRWFGADHIEKAVAAARGERRAEPEARSPPPA